MTLISDKDVEQALEAMAALREDWPAAVAAVEAAESTVDLVLSELMLSDKAPSASEKAKAWAKRTEDYQRARAKLATAKAWDRKCRSTQAWADMVFQAWRTVRSDARAYHGAAP
jgi:hypothetical protein